jgi:hypothetical protein
MEVAQYPCHDRDDACSRLSGTAIAVGTYSGAFGWHTDLLSFTGVVMVQLIAYFLAAEWALEEREW